VRLAEAARKLVDQPVTDVETLAGHAVDRNHLLAAVLAELNTVLIAFERDGFEPLRDEWQRRHVHQGQPVVLTLAGGPAEHGVARGVAGDGALLVETTAGLRRFHSGEVSVRAAGSMTGCKA
jgi:BirA family biotin operon repressor/biotin-[acetyl-CoA-carboxylase] ligase